MSAPTAYTDDTLRAYMLTCLGGLASVLGLTTDNFSDAADDVCLALGVSDVSESSDVVKVRSLARYYALRHANTYAATWYDFSADGASFSRSQVQAQLKAMLSNAEADAMPYLPSNVFAVTKATINYTTDADPYQWTFDGADDAI